MVDELYSRDRYKFEYQEGFACIKESSSFLTRLNNFLNKDVKIHLFNDKILTTKLKKIDPFNKYIITDDKKASRIAFNNWLKIEANF